MVGRLRHAVIAAAVTAACVEGTGPPVKEPLPEQALHFAQWSPTVVRDGFRSRVEPAGARGNGRALRTPAAGPAVATTYVSFWATPAETRSVRIDYTGADGSTGPFLELTIPAGALAKDPKGRKFGPRDSVLIEVFVDTVTLVVRLEPTGLVFSKSTPAQLQMWYQGANADLDADGDVDSQDGYIEQVLLGVWYQEETADPWSALTADHNLAEKWYRLALLHFSGYAVSW